jgi:hypothetical protein
MQLELEAFVLTLAALLALLVLQAAQFNQLLVPLELLYELQEYYHSQKRLLYM